MVDKLAGTLTRLARRWREDPGAFIANRNVSGDLADDKHFAAAYRSALASLHQHGARVTLEHRPDRVATARPGGSHSAPPSAARSRSRHGPG